MPQANCQAELTPGKLVQVLPDWGVAEGILDLVFTYRRVRYTSIILDQGQDFQIERVHFYEHQSINLK